MEIKKPQILRGDGSYGFTAFVDGEDLVIHNVRATFFGGNDDPEDDGTTASGINTKNNPHLMGCALPMDVGHRSPHTSGSPIPKVPWKTLVHVYSHISKREITIPVIDLGPAKPPHAHAALDLTIAAFKSLEGNLNGETIVDYRIIGGAKYLNERRT